ncbi:MAG: hypothetical protein APR54_01170 [Candidatus Cloacimonas sp. SDB]|nr:MAG: hypothetical protein APR54_01170 [Candidatus Cloacimonas sp. SDB]
MLNYCKLKMKKIIILTAIILSIMISNLNADKYAGEIFQMGAGVRNFALGNCGVSDVGSFGFAYWNAALLNEVKENRFELLHAEEYMGLLTYDTFSAIWGKDQKLSLVLTRIGIDDIPLTKLTDPEQPLSFQNRPYKYKSVNNSDLVLYLGIARKVGKYNLGFTPKLAYRNLAEESGFGFGADLSAYFRIRQNCLLGVKIRDFFTTRILWANGTHEFVNPSFDIEANYSFLLPFFKSDAKIFLRMEIFTEGRKEAASVSLKPLSMDPHLGMLLVINNYVDVLLGYDIDNLTSGILLQYKKWMINYGIELDTELENSHRLSLGYIL